MTGACQNTSRPGDRLRIWGSALLFISALHGQGIVTGKVVNAVTGDGLRHARVVFRPDLGQKRDSYAVETDSEGSFTLSGIPAAVYVAQPDKSGFAARPPDAMGSASLQRVTVRNGMRTDGVLLKLTPLAAITGLVLDPEGDPIVRARVEAMQYGYEAGGRSLLATRAVTSNDRGEYRLFGLYPGRYYVRATVDHQAPAYAATYFPAAQEAARATALDLPPGGEMRGIDLHVPRQERFSIKGRIAGGIDPSRPGADVHIQMVRLSKGDITALASNTRIDKDGFEIGNLPPGSYLVSARQDDPAVRGRILRGRTVVDVVAADVENVQLNLESGFEVAGTVQPAIPGLRIELVPSEDILIERVRPPAAASAIKQDGSFLAPAVYPGLYRIRIEPRDRAYVTSLKLNGQELQDPRIELRSAPSGPLAIGVSADMARVDGIVKDARGVPLPGANITLHPDETKVDWADHYRNVIADLEGRFSFKTIRPGRYQLFAWRDNPRNGPTDREFRKPFEALSVTVDVGPKGQQTVELQAITTDQRGR